MEMHPSEKLVGKSVTPVMAYDKVRGSVEYPSDITLPDMLYAKILRSPYPHAKIVKICSEEVERHAKVKALVTYRDVPQIPMGQMRDMYVLEDRVRFIGDEVAAVAAEDEDSAEEALQLFKVSYEPLKAVFDPEEAMRPDAPLLYPDGNIIRGSSSKPTFVLQKGDIESGLKAADVVLERTYSTQFQSPLAMEPRCCVANWDGKRLEVWESTQRPSYVRDELARVFNLAPDNVRVVAKVVGGAFGGKNFVQRYTFIASLLSMKSGRPVKISFDRREELIGAYLRYPHKICVKGGATHDGRVTALYLKLVSNAGNAVRESLTPISIASRIPFVLYARIPNIKYEAYAAYTNTPSGGGVRGYGGTEVGHVLGLFMDELAEEIGIDPLEVYTVNTVKMGDELSHLAPRATNVKVSSVGLAECLTKGAAAIGWRASVPKSVLAVSERRGFGCAIGLWTGAGGSTPSGAQVDVLEDGSVILSNPVVDHGGEQQTELRQMVGEVMGLPMEKVTSIWGDTDCCPEDLTGVVASRTTLVVGVAAISASQEAKNKLLRLASEYLQADFDDLGIEEGLIRVRSNRDLKVSFGELAKYAASRGESITGSSTCQPNDSIYSFSAAFAEVIVDVETGLVRVSKIVNPVDVGRAINPLTLEGQIVGAALQGCGYALTEEMTLDKTYGFALNQQLYDYKSPSILDCPEIIPIVVESYEPLHPFGAKGAAEAPMVPVAPAIVNAIYDAVGVRIRDLPATPDKVLAGLRRKG